MARCLEGTSSSQHRVDPPRRMGTRFRPPAPSSQNEYGLNKRLLRDRAHSLLPPLPYGPPFEVGAFDDDRLLGLMESNFGLPDELLIDLYIADFFQDVQALNELTEDGVLPI